jgi:hypothetical protein
VLIELQQIPNLACIIIITLQQTPNLRPVRLAYQPPASRTFLSEQISHQQPASSTCDVWFIIICNDNQRRT